MTIYPVPGKIRFEVSDDFSLRRGYRYAGDDLSYFLQPSAALDLLAELARAIAECTGPETAASKLRALADGFDRAQKA
jgi:hypothetical protein